MTLLLTVAATVVVAGVLWGAVVARNGARRDHRCEVRSVASTCSVCAAVVRGQARGGHMVCACGAMSPHLTGIDLLSWRATHHGEKLPSLPAGAAPSVPAASTRSTRSTGSAGSTASAASHTRAHAAEEAETADFVRMLEERSEAERRAIQRARRNPNPITPQLLREAGLTADEADAVIERMRASGELD